MRVELTAGRETTPEHREWAENTRKNHPYRKILPTFGLSRFSNGADYAEFANDKGLLVIDPG